MKTTHYVSNVGIIILYVSLIKIFLKKCFIHILLEIWYFIFQRRKNLLLMFL